MNGHQPPISPGPNVSADGTTVPTSRMLVVMSDLPTPPQAHQHASTAIPPAPAAHQQVMSMSPHHLSSGSSSPGLSPARHSPSPHSPGSPAVTLALIYPGGGPIPLTVSHTSPVGKHGGTLGALTASVNALQRPISTAGLHTATSYPVIRTSLAPGCRPSLMPFNPMAGPRARSPKQQQRVIMTTKTPIFNRSHAVPATTTAGVPCTTVTMPPGMVRVSPSTQAVRAQVQAQAAHAQAQAARAQAHLQAVQQARHIFPQSSAGIPPTSSAIGNLANPTGGQMIRSQNPTINNAQARLQQALANAAAKYREHQHRNSQFGPVSPISSPPLGLVAPSVQQRNRPIPNPPPSYSQAIKPAPHIPILPKSSYTPIMAKPVNLKSDGNNRNNNNNSKPKAHDKKPTPKPGSQFGHGHSSEVRRSKKPAVSLPTATVSATASTPHIANIAGILKEVTDAFRPEISARREASVRPELSFRPETDVRTEVTVMSDVVTIKENGFMEKEVPRAIVRPQVLTHVIDGFIIEESKEPFPVSHTPEMPDVIPEQQPHTPKPHKQHKPKQQPKKDNAENTTEVENMLRCEFCGKTAPARNFTRSKRFCSLSCAKRYNVGCSKKLGLFSPKREHPERAKHSMKLQTKAKPLKGVRGKHGRLSFNVGQPWLERYRHKESSNWQNENTPQASDLPPKLHHHHHHEQQQHPQQHQPQQQQPQQHQPQQELQQQQLEERTESTTSSSDSSSNPPSASDETSSLSARAPSPSQASEPDTAPASDDPFEESPPAGPISRDPAKWSVQDVYEFIQALPGCESYADEFQKQEIDGQALLLLKEDHLMTALNMKLGPALKVINRINSLKDGK
ncbi:uncharacterized protein [Amphiura filiformis]|uniref:uncharacterized protein isoform X2 n=1 Tax=Amphiura filiformis TaxID=82378 RepID=UPI003B2175F8